MSGIGAGDDSVEYMRHRMILEEMFSRRRKQSMSFLAIAVFAAAVMICLAVLLPPTAGILKRQEQLLAAQVEGMHKIPDLTTRLNKLDSQIALLTTESVDARIQTLEKALHAGGIKPEDIATLVDLKQEVDVLKTYMFRDPKELVELKELQLNYRNLAETVSQAATKDMVRSEIGILQLILSIALGVFGIVLTVLFGSWWFMGRRSSQRDESPTTPINRTPPAAPAAGEVR